ncbi:MAG: ABC transporter substrate-binding protein [Immundisolibacterales bacterium]|nr:ABC transporter substrate-binding protein [Immundisolibacterales bacterium]
MQSDEDWWKVAWNTGIWIGEVAFDRSAVEPSIALATRFESATNGERLGVLKVSINLRSIQDLMSNGTHGSPGLELTIFDPRGRILAETASEHATDRILAGDDRAPRVPPDYPSGYTASAGAPPVGFARTAGTTRYASAGARYAGLEWLVTATLDPEALTERRASLDHLADALARAGAWPDLALAAAVSSAALGALAAFFTVWLVLRRVDADAQVLDSLLESLEDGRDLWTDPPRSATFSGITERVRRVAGVGREPKDLEGRRLGAPPPDGAFAVWPAFARAAGVDRTKVNVVPVTFREREPALARGEVDAITGYSFSSWLGARAQGLPEDDLTLILMRHHGLDLYGNAIIASPWLVKERPEALASFLRVAVHAYREAFRVPDAAIEALAMHEPGIHIATETERLRLAIRDNFLTDEVRRFGFGAIDNDRLERAMDQLGETWDYLVRPGITDIFDPSFLPPLEERRVGPAP